MKDIFPEPTLESIQQKLQRGSEQRAFSTDINPKECSWLLRYLIEHEPQAVGFGTMTACGRKDCSDVDCGHPERATIVASQYAPGTDVR